MAFRDIFKDFFKPIGDEDEDGYDYDTREYREPAPTRREPEPSGSGYVPRGTTPQPTYTPRRESAYSGNTTYERVPVTATLEVVRVAPKEFRRDSAAIVDNLRDGRAIIVNFEQSDTELARRVLDFMSGAAFALDATPERVAELVYVITPKNVRMFDDPATLIEESSKQL
ncbi:MAG: cell division protein SepF [Oscillospiraceae bacterium]|jgi:cell division inhibitor SepF|nr:cell division protein SepF [Oscillospiraceae bacterium]